jgi:hypothetical protein
MLESHHGAENPAYAAAAPPSNRALAVPLFDQSNRTRVVARLVAHRHDPGHAVHHAPRERASDDAVNLSPLLVIP